MTANVAPSRYRNQTLIRLYVPLVLSDVHVCNPLDFTVQARKLWYAIKNDLCSPLNETIHPPIIYSAYPLRVAWELEPTGREEGHRSATYRRADGAT